MQKTFALVAVLLAGCASAVIEFPVYTFSAPHTNGQLFDSPCKDEKVLAHVREEFRSRFKRASGDYEGKVYGVCWAWSLDESVAVVVWDDGGNFAVPKHVLKKPTTT